MCLLLDSVVPGNVDRLGVGPSAATGEVVTDLLARALSRNSFFLRE
jgi:hypothetical protein